MPPYIKTPTKRAKFCFLNFVFVKQIYPSTSQEIAKRGTFIPPIFFLKTPATSLSMSQNASEISLFLDRTFCLFGVYGRHRSEIRHIWPTPLRNQPSSRQDLLNIWPRLFSSRMRRPFQKSQSSARSWAPPARGKKGKKTLSLARCRAPPARGFRVQGLGAQSCALL